MKSLKQQTRKKNDLQRQLTQPKKRKKKKKRSVTKPKRKEGKIINYSEINH